VIDDAVVVRGGDFVDLNVHGGVWVVKSILDLAQREGFEVVEDALEMMDGKTTLEKEVMAALALAGTELAIRVLLAQPEVWKNSKADLEDRSLWWLLHPPRVAIVGVANVGKSTLANQLFAQERSLVADVPGTTRDWVGEMANLDGLMVMLVDTPGIRETSDGIEREAIERSGAEVGRADLIVVVVDQTQEAREQVELARTYPGAIIVANKKDRPAMWDVGQYFKGAIGTVARSGEGVEALKCEIRKRFGCENMDVKRARWWTERQRRELMRGNDAAAGG
ncbi:MAG TPA: GTPase, partial [Tepidisphaeraceae bacterium]|nr:GTPase [Tepidisphaeraceae bacterium]